MLSTETISASSNPTGAPDPASGITLSPITTPHDLKALKRLNTLLLPIPYPERFYTDITAHPLTDGALTRLAFSPTGLGAIGAVRARYERPAPDQGETPTPEDDGRNNGARIYIMTLCTLSPFRGLGVATRLLEHVVGVAREWGVSEVYAHVWEANVEALGWYEGRGFVSGEVVGGYYRRLKPDGAVVVRLRVA